MINYFYAFISNLISHKEFEDWVYSSVDLLKANLKKENELYLQLISCDYSSSVESEHLKVNLYNKYKDCFDLITYSDFISTADKKLKLLVKKHNEMQPIVIFDCTGIDNKSKLHSRIKKVFKLPEWYGMNWDAFNDIIDLSNIKEIKFINFMFMKEKIPDDANTFLKLLIKNNDRNCTFTYL